VRTVDPRTPVIVGAAQINDRDYGCEPLELMVRCTRAALDDTSSNDGFVSTLDAVRGSGGSGRMPTLAGSSPT